MPRPKRWRPLNLTKKDIQEGMKRFGSVAPEVIELHVNREEKGDELLAACDAILSREPENCIALLYKGNLLMERKHPKKALESLDKVVAIVPLVYPAWQYKGMCELQLKRYRAARFSFARLMEFTSHQAFAHCCIALTFYMAGNKDFAVKFLDDIIAIGTVEDPEILVHVRAMFEERMGLKDEAFIHYLEGQMMAKEKDADTAFKIHSLASKDAEEE